MPWVCQECTLVNADDAGKECDLCGSSRTGKEEKSIVRMRKTLSAKHFEVMSAKTGGSGILASPPPMSAPKKRSAVNLDGVFGVELVSSTPTLVCDCIAYLRANGMDTEGVYRIPGDSNTVDFLKAEYEKHNGADDTHDVLTNGGSTMSVHDVATLCKMFFRELPSPLVPHTHYDVLMDAVRTEHASKEELIKATVDVVRSLPDPNKSLLGMLLNFLSELSQNSEVNKMTPANLATCFAPSLLRAPDDADPTQALMDMSTAIGALNILIKVADVLDKPDPQHVLDNTLFVAKVAELKPPPGMGNGVVSVDAPPGM